MNNSCNIPIDPLLDIAANGKRCRGILYKYLRELLTVRLSFTRKQLRPRYRWQPVATVSTKAKRIVVGSSWNACPFETCAVRTVCVPGDTIRGPCWVHQSRNIDAKKKKKLERRVGKTREKGYNDGVNEGWRGITEARETLVDRRSGWRGREWGSGRERERERVGCALATSPDDPEHTIYQSVLSIIRVYSCRPRINLVPLLFASVKFSRSPAVVLN